MPGGAAGLKVVVEQLHARGVKVLWPYHPWDHSTRGQEMNNLTDPLAMAELLRDTNIDGIASPYKYGLNQFRRPTGNFGECSDSLAGTAPSPLATVGPSPSHRAVV